MGIFFIIIFGIIIYFGIGLGIIEYLLKYKTVFYCQNCDDPYLLFFVWPIFLVGIIVYKIIVKVFER